jgi:rod shape-determining protein MreB
MQTRISSLFGLFSRDLGIDLGAANTLVHCRGKGIVISEPSVVAMDADDREVLAVGSEARAIAGRTDGHVASIHPLKNGVIADGRVLRKVLGYLISKAHDGGISPSRPRVVIGVPGGATEGEKREVKDAALAAGAREAHTVEEAMAAGLGAGLPVSEPIGSMLVDIGSGSTDVAVLSLGGIVLGHSAQVGGHEIDTAIIQFARQNASLLIGERMAEGAKIVAGSAYPLEEERRVTLRGWDVLTGLPRSTEVSSAELREAIQTPVDRIVELVKLTLEQTPPDLVADISEFGITLTGGGALLLGLDRRIMAETNMPVQVADDPLTCVVRGTGKVVESLPEYHAALRAGRELCPPA